MEPIKDSSGLKSVRGAGQILLYLILYGALFFSGFMVAKFLDIGGAGLGKSPANVEEGAATMNLKGEWVLQLDIMAKRGLHASGKQAPIVPAGKSSQTIKVSIEEQDGNLFAGTFLNDQGRESFVGAIGFTGNFLDGTTEGGYFWADFINPDKAIVIYHHRDSDEVVTGRGTLYRTK